MHNEFAANFHLENAFDKKWLSKKKNHIFMPENTSTDFTDVNQLSNLRSTKIDMKALCMADWGASFLPCPQIQLNYYIHTCQWQAIVVSQYTFLPI